MRREQLNLLEEAISRAGKNFKSKKAVSEVTAESAVTVATTVRILRTQETAIQRLPPNFNSRSELFRHLLKLYLDGKIPDFLPEKDNSHRTTQ